MTPTTGQSAAPRRRAIALFAPVLCGAMPAAAQAPPDFAARLAPAFVAAEAPHSAGAQAAMLAVPAGSYPVGRAAGPAEQRPAHRVALAGFRIDRTEVTNAAFSEYLNALRLGLTGSAGAGGIGRLPSAAAALLREGREGSGSYPIIALDDDQARIDLRDGVFVPRPGHADHPVAEVTWAGARAYCAWRGARLPSEAEWEAAARGTDDRRFPWGDAAPDESRAFLSGRSGVTAPVGGRPAGASPFGVLDMAGSMAEWTSTLRRHYPYDAADGREAPDAPGERVTRGGDYRYDRTPERMTVSHRDGFSNAPERGHRHIGFRCAAS